MSEVGLEAAGLLRVCRLAEGGMARVDLAIKRVGDFRRMYAVKRLHPHLASDPEFRQMFLDEAKLAGLIRHPNVVGVLDVGEDALGPFLVMDYVDGLPLSNVVARARRLGEPVPVQVALRIALDVARGLHAAHELVIDGRAVGLVHRDLSPQNILIGFDGQARLTDFGIAKALDHGQRTATGVVKGKTSYLSPEQIRGVAIDRRSDLFALGVVLFELLSGERLYRRGDGASDMRAIAQEPVPDVGELRSDVPDGLVQLLFELLAKRPELRPGDADQVARRLELLLAECLQGEAALTVVDYVELIAGEAKREQARVLADAVAAAEQGTSTPSRTPVLLGAEALTPPPTARPWPRWARGLGALLVVVAIGLVARLSQGPTGALPPEASPPAEAPGPSTVGPKAATAPAGEPEFESAAPPTNPTPGPEPKAALRPDPSPPKAPPPAPSSRKKKRPNRAAARPDPKSLPDWVEFDR